LEGIVATGNNLRGGAAFSSWLTSSADRRAAAIQMGNLAAPRVKTTTQVEAMLEILGADQREVFVQSLLNSRVLRRDAEIDSQRLLLLARGGG
jgi:hypothetical protein